MSNASATIRKTGDATQATHESSLIMGGPGVHADRKALGVSEKAAARSFLLSRQAPSSIRHSSLMDASRNLLGSSIPLNDPPPNVIITSATSSTVNESSPPSSSALTPSLAPRAPLGTSNAQKPAALMASKRSSTIATVPPKDVDGPARRLNHHRSVSALTLFPRKAETSTSSARSSTSLDAAKSARTNENKNSPPGKPALNRISATPSVTVKPAQTRLPRPTSMVALKSMSHAGSPVNGATSISTSKVNTMSRSTQRNSFMSRLASSIGNGTSSRKSPMETRVRASKIPAFNETIDVEEMLDIVAVSGEDVVDPAARQMAFEQLVGYDTGGSSSSASEFRPASRTGTERTRKDALPMLPIPSRQQSVTASRKPAPSIHVTLSPARKTTAGRAKATQAVTCTPQSKASTARGITTALTRQSSLGPSKRSPMSPRSDLPVVFPALSETSKTSPVQHLSPLMSTPRGRKVSNQSDIDFRLEQSMAQHHESPLGGLSPQGALLRSSIGRSSLSGGSSNRMSLSEMPLPSALNLSQLKAHNTPSPKVAARVAKTSDGTPSRRPSTLGNSPADRSAATPPTNSGTLGRSARPSTTTATRLSQLEAEANNAKQESSALIDKVISLGMQSREAAQQVELLEVERDALQNQVKQMEQEQQQQVALTEYALRRRQVEQSREDLAKAWDAVVHACQAELLRAESEAAAKQQLMANLEGSVAMAEAAV